MVCETILVSGARVEGLTNLTIRGIDLEECVLWLDEKNDKLVPQRRAQIRPREPGDPDVLAALRNASVEPAVVGNSGRKGDAAADRFAVQ